MEAKLEQLKMNICFYSKHSRTMYRFMQGKITLFFLFLQIGSQGKITLFSLLLNNLARVFNVKNVYNVKMCLKMCKMRKKNTTRMSSMKMFA